MKAQLQALKSMVKRAGSKAIKKLGEATLSEHELREKNGVESVKSNEEKLKEAQEATSIPSRRAPAVMNVGRRIIK